jgi:hypothetical protein
LAEAIRHFKIVAADVNARPAIRANAVEYMGFLVLSLPTSEAYDLVFTEYPYESFLEDTYLGSIQNLFEYAASLGPLPAADARAAQLYLLEAYDRKQQDTSFNPEEDSLVKEALIYLGKVTEEELALARNRQDPSLPRILEARAVSIGLLQVLGANPSVSPEQAFEEALSAVREFSGTRVRAQREARVNLQYAAYLARRYGAAQSTQIHTWLEEMQLEHELTKAFFSSLKDERETLAWNDVRLVASADQEFKAYLTALGWAL